MKRLLFILMLPLASAALAIEPEAVVELTCEGEVVGSASLTDGVLDVTLTAEPECSGDILAQIGDVTYVVVVEATDGGFTVTFDGEQDYTDEVVEVTPKEDEPDVDEPETVLHGLDRADEVAGEHGQHGRDIARSARERVGGAIGKAGDVGKAGLHGKGRAGAGAGQEDVEDDAEVDADAEVDVEADAEDDAEFDAEVGVGASVGIGLD